MIVRELITRLGFSTNTSQLSNAEKATERLKDRAEQAASAFRNIVAAVAGLATVKTIIGISDEMQNIRTRVGQLPQTVSDAGAAFDEVAARASAAGVKIDAYTTLYTRIGNAAKDYITTQEDLLGISDTLSRALVVGGASTQEASSAIIQFSQALGSGVLQGDEFRSMAEAAPQYLDKLAETMNIPREQLKKMASDGKLTAKAVIEATRQMSDYFGEKFKEIPMTVGRAMTIVGNRFSMMLDRMNRELNFVTKIANLILAGFDKIKDGVDKLVKAFGGWNNMFRLIGIAIGVALGAKAIAILSAFRAASLLAMLPFLKMISIISAVALVLEDLYVWIQGGDSLIGSLIGPWKEWAPYVMSVINIVRDAVVWFGEAIGAVAAMIVGMLTLDGDLFMEGLKGLTGLLWSVIQQWWAYLVESFKEAWNSVSQFFIDAMTSLGRIIYDAIFDPIINAVKDAWNNVKGIAKGAWEIVKSSAALGSSIRAGTGPLTGVPSVTPAQLAPTAMGLGRPSVQSNTNVTVTVPPGTTAEQAKFLQGAAQQSFRKGADDKLARDLAVYAP